MRLQDLIYKVNILKVIGSTDLPILDVQFDSRKITSGSLFVAIEGVINDGHKYIEDTIQNGAVAILVEKIPDRLNEKITYIQVNNSAQSLALIASNFYNNPSEKIKLVGVTGTNGKTTVVNLLHQLFRLLDQKAGMLSTIENKIVDEVTESTHTTPDPLQINCLLDKMVVQGCEYCFMEVSSHAITQHRISGLEFRGGVFTNLSQDHLDYHKTFGEYRDVKKTFFDFLQRGSFALTNKDDRNGAKMLENTRADKFTYALKSLADYKCKVIEKRFEGMLLQIDGTDCWVKLTGEFNAYNLLAVCAIAMQFGFKSHDVLTALSLLNPPEGRFELVRNDDAVVGIVDYAHTDDALKKLLETINNIRTQRETLITVFGCGGDRDKSKRSIMTKVVCKLSTQVIITSDNPRTEDPQDIFADMIRDLDHDQKNNLLVITDRREAIMTAGRLANSNDIILVAGKGHEQYQEIQGKKRPFNDMEELKRSLNINLE